LISLGCYVRFPLDAGRQADTVRGPRCASFGNTDRSKRRQSFIFSWMTLIVSTPRKRRDPEDINRLPFLITRRQDNGLAPFNSVAALLSSPHTRAGRYDFLLPKRERGEKRNNLRCAPIGTYDPLICQVSGHLECNDQNSAGRYPLISRPMHTSTSVGVVHNMSALPLWLWGQDPFILKASLPARNGALPEEVWENCPAALEHLSLDQGQTWRKIIAPCHQRVVAKARWP
jgi:hypothetical protein